MAFAFTLTLVLGRPEGTWSDFNAHLVTGLGETLKKLAMLD